MKYIKSFQSIKESINNDLNKWENWVDKYIEESFSKASMDDKEELEAKLITYINTDFPYGLKNIPDKIVLYRLLSFSDDSPINKKKLGKHFVGDYTLLENKEFHHSINTYRNTYNLKHYIVSIETDINNIDIETTIALKVIYMNEYEYTIKDDTNLKILNIVPLNDEDGINESIKASEAYTTLDSYKTLEQNKRNIAWLQINNVKNDIKKYISDSINNNDFGFIIVDKNPSKPIIVYRNGYRKQAEELFNIANKYNGYLSVNATYEDSKRIGELLEYEQSDIETYLNKNY